MSDGAHLLLFNGEGGEFEATLVSAGGGARARVGVRRPVVTESRLEIGLAQGLSRGTRMDYTIQKAVELGVHWMQPLLTERSVVRPDSERAGRRRDHWRAVVASACEQCGRALLPPVHDPLPLSEWLDRLSPCSDKLVATPDAFLRPRRPASPGRAAHRARGPGGRTCIPGSRRGPGPRLRSVLARTTDPAHRDCCGGGAERGATALGRSRIRPRQLTIRSKLEHPALRLAFAGESADQDFGCVKPVVLRNARCKYLIVEDITER